MAKVKKGPQGAVTTAAHKARRIKREQIRQLADYAQRPRRDELRKRGALNRIERRIRDAGSESERSRLQSIRLKVAAAYTHAKAAA